MSAHTFGVRLKPKEREKERRQQQQEEEEEEEEEFKVEKGQWRLKEKKYFQMESAKGAGKEREAVSSFLISSICPALTVTSAAYHSVSGVLVCISSPSPSLPLTHAAACWFLFWCVLSL